MGGGGGNKGKIPLFEKMGIFSYRQSGFFLEMVQNAGRFNIPKKWKIVFRHRKKYIITH